MSFCWRAANSQLRVTAQVLTCTVWLVNSMAVLAQSDSPDQGNTSTVLIQHQGQQKQRLMEGQAATELSRRQAKELVQDPPSGVPPDGRPASSPKPVTQADVLLQREERIRRLNAAKVEPPAAP